MLAELIVAMMVLTPLDQTVNVAKGTKLDVNNFAGDINIKVWDRDAVRVEVNHSDREAVDIKQGDQMLTVRSRSLRGGPPRSLDYVITVPKWMAINVNGLYRLTTHNGLVAMAVPEKANVTLMVRTYNGGFKSTFQVPGDTGERRKRFTMTLGNGSAHVELESFGGTISLRRPGEPRPETERRQRRDKADLKLDLKELAHLDIDQTVREAM